MEEAGLKLQVKRTFGRSQADIFLNGITVLTGISDHESRIKNLMQFLYTSLKVVVDYPKIISGDLADNLRRIAFALSVIVRKLPQSEILFPDIRRFDSVNLSDWIDLVDKIHLHLKTYHPDLLFEKGKFFFEEEEGEKADMTDFLKESLYDFFLESAYHMKQMTQGSLLGVLRDEITSCFSVWEKRRKKRSVKFLKDHLHSLLEKNELPEVFDFFENGIKKIGYKEKSYDSPETVKRVIWIPAKIEFLEFPEYYDISDMECWENIYSLLHQGFGTKKNDLLCERIKYEIIGGEVHIKEVGNLKKMDQLDFTYLNGHTIPLCECEDGFQSFIIMQLLLTHGCLDHETLILVESPDLFLSPCKIADYVRMCIWIHKEQGTRFIFSTYNRDVITAINHYYQVENLSAPLNYYIANNTRSTFNYSYHFSGNNVSPVLEYLKMEMK